MIIVWALFSYIFMWFFNLPWGAFFTLWTALFITNAYSAYKSSQETLELFKFFK